jgi:hypothetical protein
MRFNVHSDLAGKHAFLSPSVPHWVNYDEQKLEARYWSFRSSVRGTDLHALAHEAIRLGVTLDPSLGAIAAYVADAIAMRMACEQPLYYSENAFGTADTLSFDEVESFLHIHDLKTGVTPAKPRQLELYAAYFCLEYEHNPLDIQIELRIYQGEQVDVYIPTPEAIQMLMDRTVYADNHIQFLKEANQ